jgi:U1 small nuclear ribonucleoprotein
MTAHLPPQLLALFAPRPPIPYIPPLEKDKLPPYTGIASFVSQFEPVTEQPQQQVNFPFDNKKERKRRRIEEKLKKHEEELETLVKQCKYY